MSVWETRDKPVLAGLLDLLANPLLWHGVLYVHAGREQPHPAFPSVSDAEFCLAVLTLRDAGLVTWTHTEPEGGGNSSLHDFMVTGAGKQALGLWPAFDALGSPAELAWILEALADDAGTDEERSNLRRAAAAVRRSAPELVKAGLVGALSAVARAQLGV
jgi:hypothetical protein